MNTLRVKFQKIGDIRYISHLDMMKVFHRALRRAEIPISYSQGFNPHPVISFATALSLGTESYGEYLDLKVEEALPFEDFQLKMNRVLPEGIQILEGKYMGEKPPSLMSMVLSSDYELRFEWSIKSSGTLSEYIRRFLEQEEIIIERKKKKKRGQRRQEFKNVDIKPLITNISVIDESTEKKVLKLDLAAGSKGNLKPEDLLKAFESFLDCLELDYEIKDPCYVRVDLYQNDGEPKKNLLQG